MIPVAVNTAPHKPRAPPPAVRLIEPLKEQLRRLGINREDGPTEAVWEAGYRNSPQIAALLVNKRLRTTLHPLVARAISEMKQPEVAGDMAADNEYSKTAGKRAIRITKILAIAAGVMLAPLFAWGFMPKGTAQQADQVQEMMNIVMNFSIVGIIPLFATIFTYASSIGARTGASHVLIDHTYEFLSDTANQEALAQMLSVMKKTQ